MNNSEQSVSEVELYKEDHRMKIGIIIYSLSGNTAFVAGNLKEKLLAAGHEVNLEQVSTVGKGPPAEKTFQLKTAPGVSGYDGLIFGSPVHAFSLSQVMSAYLDQLPSLQGKKVACFVTKLLPFHWTGGNRAVARMKKVCESKGGEVCGSAVAVFKKSRRDSEVSNAVNKLCSLF